MSEKDYYLILVTGILFFLVIATRFLPFWMKKFFERSVLLRNIGILMPGVIMLLLTLHSLRCISFEYYYQCLPEVIGLGMAVLLYYWKRNLLLAFVPSTLTYLLIKNYFF